MNADEYLADLADGPGWHESFADGLAGLMQHEKFRSALGFIIELQKQAIVNMALTDTDEGLPRVKEVRDNYRGMLTVVSMLCELATKEDEDA